MKHIALFLHEIYFGKKTGRLVFKAEGIEKYFFFQEGNLVQVKTNRPEERLGEVLFKLEKISRDAHARMDDFIEPNTNVGEVLKTRGLISEQDLDDALVYQLRETTLNAFPYFAADIVFQERAGGSVEKGEHRISVPFLIEYGIRRLAYDPALKGFMSMKTPSVKKRTLAYLLTDEEKKLWESVNGQIQAEKLAATLPFNAEFFWKTLYLLYCLDLIDFKKAEEAGIPAGSAPAGEPRAKDSARAFSNGEAAQIADIIAMHESLPSRNYYQILGISKNANEDDVKKAYFGLARKYHPDRFERSIQTAYRSQIESVFDAITNAYKTLSSREKRRAYDSGAEDKRGEDSQDVMKIADIKFRQGKTLYTQERFDDAIGLLEEAVRIRKDKGDYYLLLAMAESKIPAYRKKAEEDFLKAVGLEPWNPEAYVGLGFLYKNEGLLTKAARQFQKAVEADPDHKLAGQELEQLEKGTRKKGLKGLFSLDLFGSKKKK
jgi:curved DNA-binding protein CbpA